ncbi:chemotaxis protein [Fischerella thermalis CCMEE 5268]|uniref:Chemotaxis protein n=1 Tax=Fischerella thermalis CCMEE 5268 TaxID=2019662 RepID=A0A2N6KDQ1_9CYAN|nr:methyl-accepting chemotaxis protein [Fischerella thermalis]PLZ96932.1 chemotaxis protein [Fischerella thermalis CCMEE 5268]
MLKIDRSNYQHIFKSGQTHATSTPKVKKSLWRRFISLPVSSKNLTVLIFSQLSLIVGLGISSTVIINRSFQSQSLKQVKSELNIADLNYHLKLNQAKFNLHNQANSTDIINAAELHVLGNQFEQYQQNHNTRVRQILKNEAENLNIEYLALVSLDRRIIASSNSNKYQGKVFDPQGLVSQVLKNPRQIQAHTVINSSELSQQLPWMSSDLSNQDALMNYTLTPVKSLTNNQVIGVLVAGDVVNEQEDNAQLTQVATDNAYSAVYINKGAGEFALATSLAKSNKTDLTKAIANLDLPDKSILAQAAVRSGEIVTGQIIIDQQPYAIAAKAIPNITITTAKGNTPVLTGEPVAILVQITKETELQTLVRQNRLHYALAAVIALIVIGIWTYIFKRTTVQQIEKLKDAIQKFTNGDRFARVRIYTNDEVGQLAVAFNQMAETIAQKAYQQENESKIAKQVNSINLRIRGLLNTAQILNVAVTTMREVIKVDRVVVYRFDENWVGKIVAECVDDEWPSALGAEIADPCFAKDYIDKYQKGRVQAIENIYEVGLTECHIAQLEAFAVKANLVAPILLNNKLYGLLIAHQCSSPRQWQESEIDLFKQVAIPIGYALEQAYVLEHSEKARSRAELLAIEQSQQKEALQQQIIKLLREVEGASKGDLTVYAEVTHGEIGTVADFFNCIVENLREIVTKVKTSAIQVNTALGENEGAIRQLANEAIKQAVEINRTLDSVERMTLSIAEVADNAQKAAQIAHTASRTAQKGEIAMDLTVEKIFNLRSTIDDTTKKVKRLGDSSQQISRIVCLINEIAVQTNLLAVNAGLEASRAGESSRGFMVVATEVGELAVRCSDATQEIKQIVENIQRETNEVIKAMEQGTTQVVEGSRIVEDAKISLNQILTVSREIDELVQSISQATVSQVETSQAVTKLITEISQVSEITRESSRSISQSLQETLGISRELEATVEKFKVK